MKIAVNQFSGVKLMTAQTAGTVVIHQRQFKANGELSPGSPLISSKQLGWEHAAVMPCFVLNVLQY